MVDFTPLTKLITDAKHPQLLPRARRKNFSLRENGLERSEITRLLCLGGKRETFRKKADHETGFEI